MIAKIKMILRTLQREVNQVTLCWICLKFYFIESQIELKSSASTPNLQFLSGSKPSTAPDFKLGVNLKFDKRSSMQIMAPAIKLEPEVKVSQFKSKGDDKTVLKSKISYLTIFRQIQ